MFSPQQIISYLSVCYVTVNQSVFLFFERDDDFDPDCADDFTQWGLYTENDKQSLSYSFSLSLCVSLHPIMILRQTPALSRLVGLLPGSVAFSTWIESVVWYTLDMRTTAGSEYL